MHKWLHVSTYVLVPTFIFVAACGGSKAPVATMSKAETAIRQAEQKNAQEAAPLEMRLAREKLDRAKEAMNAERHDKARRLADEATVEAELALAKTESAEAKKQVAQFEKSISTLREEIESKSRRPQ